MNPYEVLGLQITATIGEVKIAYRQLAKQYHPDLNKTDDAEARMKRINEAYEMIMKGWKPEPVIIRQPIVWYYYGNFTYTSTTATSSDYYGTT